MKEASSTEKLLLSKKRRRARKSSYLVRNSYWLVRDKLETSKYGKWKVTDLTEPSSTSSVTSSRISPKQETNDEEQLTTDEEGPRKRARFLSTEDIEIKNEDFGISPVLVNRLDARFDELKRKFEWLPDIDLQMKENEEEGHLPTDTTGITSVVEEKEANGINLAESERTTRTTDLYVDHQSAESNIASPSQSDSSWSVNFDDLNKVVEDVPQRESYVSSLTVDASYPLETNPSESTKCLPVDQESITNGSLQLGESTLSGTVPSIGVEVSPLEIEDSESEPDAEPIARTAPSITLNTITIVSSEEESSHKSKSSDDSDSEISSSDSSDESSSDSSEDSSSDEESPKPIVQYTRETIPKHLMKYWNQRFKYFSKFNEGIQMDEEGWYSVTPENIAAHIARRCQCDTIIDAFCGVGGNAIQFAFYCERVIAIDIDETRLNCARNNARVYGVEGRIEFIHGNYLELLPKLKADVVFLSPPWGGPEYNQVEIFDLRNMPIDGVDLYHKTTQITHNIAYFVPRNTDPNQLADLAGPGNTVEVEQQKLYGAAKSITAYYGDLQVIHQNPEDEYGEHHENSDRDF